MGYSWLLLMPLSIPGRTDGASVWPQAQESLYTLTDLKAVLAQVKEQLYPLIAKATPVAL